jgi:hypothetical protein
MEQKPEDTGTATGRGSLDSGQPDSSLPRYGEGGRSLWELPGHVVRLLAVMVGVALRMCAEWLTGGDWRGRK